MEPLSDERLDALDLAERFAELTAEPPSAAVAREFIALGRGALRNMRRERATAALDRAEQILDTAAVDGELRRALETERIHARFRELDSIETAARVVDDADALLARLGREELSTRARLLLHKGRVLGWCGTPHEFARAAEALGESAGLFRVLENDFEAADALAALGYTVQAATGYLVRARDTLEEAARLVPEGSRRQGLWLAFLAEIEQTIGEDASAARHAEAAHAIGLRFADDRLTAYAAWERARIEVARGDWTSVERWCREAERHPGDWLENRSGVEFRVFKVEWAWRVGRDDLVPALLAAAAEAAERCGYAGQTLLARAFGAIVEERFTDAAALVARAKDAGFRSEEVWRLDALCGWALIRSGDVEGAIVRARAAAAELDSLGIPGLALLREPRVWPPLVAVLSPPAPIRPPHIVLLGETAVEFDGMRQMIAEGHARTLIGVLALVGRPMTVEEAGDALWPDVRSDVARRRLRNVVSRIRGFGPLIDRTGGTIALARDVSVDLVQFEAQTTDALSHPPGPDRARLARRILAEHGLGLLLGADDPRIDAARERVARLQHALLESIVDGASAWDERLDAARRLLRVDPFADSLCDRLADELAAAGRNAEARIWRDHARAIRVELGIGVDNSVDA